METVSVQFVHTAKPQSRCLLRCLSASAVLDVPYQRPSSSSNTLSRLPSLSELDLRENNTPYGATLPSSTSGLRGLESLSLDDDLLPLPPMPSTAESSHWLEGEQQGQIGQLARYDSGLFGAGHGVQLPSESSHGTASMFHSAAPQYRSPSGGPLAPQPTHATSRGLRRLPSLSESVG